MNLPVSIQPLYKFFRLTTALASPPLTGSSIASENGIRNGHKYGYELRLFQIIGGFLKSPLTS